MAQLVKHFHTSNDMSLDPQDHVEKMCVVAYDCNHSTSRKRWEIEKGESRNSWVSSPGVGSSEPENLSQTRGQAATPPKALF